MEGGEPCIVVVPYNLLKSDLLELDVTAYLGSARPSRTQIEIAGFREGPRLSLRPWLSLIFSYNSIAEGRYTNKCIQAIHGGAGFHWCDSVLAVRRANVEGKVRGC